MLGRRSNRPLINKWQPKAGENEPKHTCTGKTDPQTRISVILIAVEFIPLKKKLQHVKIEKDYKEN